MLGPGPQWVHTVETQQLGADAGDSTVCPPSSVPVVQPHRGGRLAVQPAEMSHPGEGRGCKVGIIYFFRAVKLDPSDIWKPLIWLLSCFMWSALVRLSAKPNYDCFLCSVHSRYP